MRTPTSRLQVKPLLGNHYQLDLQYSDPEIRELRGTVWYTNGSREQINLKFSDLVDAFSEDQIRTLEMLGGLAGAAIARARARTGRFLQ